MKYPLLVLAAMLIPGLRAPAAESVPGFSHVRSLEGIDEYRLDANGLDVLLVADHASPVVTLGVAYRVGSRNEVTGSTGSTHLLEHLMFRGSQHFNADLKNSLEEQLERVGARYNANTWDDRTNYFETVGRGSLEIAVRAESDRMRGLLLRESDRSKEMTVVRNEYERGKNDPANLLEEELYAAAYIAQPYHHPTIGWRSDIERVPIEKLRAFYNTFYWPNNATVTLVGDFDAERALALIQKYYGAIPRSPHPIPEMYTVEPDQTGPRRIVVKRAGDLGVVAIGYKTPPSLSPDSPAIEVLTTILVEGKGSRLYHALTDKGLATSVDADDAYFRDGSLDVLLADLAPGAGHAAVEAVMTEEVRKVRESGVTPAEVATAQSEIVAASAFRRDGPTAATAQIEDAIAVGDWTDYVNRQKHILSVTPEDVRRVAQAYFLEDQSTTGWFVPVHGPTPPSREAQALAKGKTEAEPSAPDRNVPGFTLSGTDPWAGPLTESASSQAQEFASRVKRRVVAGVDVLSMKTGSRDIVTLQGSLDAGRVAGSEENCAVAELVGQMLDKGTLANDKFVLAQKLSSVGAELQFAIGGNTLNFSGRCLRKDVPLVLDILSEELRQPLFSAEEFTKAQKSLKGRLLREKTDTNAQAARALSQGTFPAGHPNWLPPVERMIADADKTTVDDLKAFHGKFFGPAGMHLVLVGDVDDAVIDQKVGRDFLGWTGGRTAQPIHPVGKASASPVRTVQIPDKTSVTVMIGEADGLKLSDPDQVALAIATAILGQGFSGRLMSVVRNKDGLTYGIYAYVQSQIYSEGSWQINATFAPALLDRGMKATREVLEDWYEHGVTPEELTYRKTNEVGEFQVGLATNSGLAHELLSCVQAGLGPDYLDAYPKKVAALTLEQVNGAIRRYLDPKLMATVLAGTVPEAQGPQPAKQ